MTVHLRNADISRRGFMIGAAGLTFAVASRLPVGPAQAAGKEAVLSPWVTISTDDTVAIMSPAAEMGQGSLTSLPLILAEELDADWSKVRIVVAPPNDALYKNPAFGFMYTAGSNAVTAYFKDLRRFGAQVRKVLLANAARHWNVPVEELATEPNAVVHAKSGRRLTYGEIAAFAEIGQFIDRPVKTYSSGMMVRLAFSVAIHVDPEILLVDEALAVGDVYFRQRCVRKVHELRSRGITILFVSHATGDVKALGDRALWLDRGHVMAIGKTDQVVSKYLAAMEEKDARFRDWQIRDGGEASSENHDPVPAAVVEGIPNIDHRFGDGRAEVIGIGVLDAHGTRLSSLRINSTIIVRISVRAKENIERPIVGFMFRNHLGVDFAGTNTARERCDLAPLAPGQICTVDFHLDLPALYASLFSFSPAVADGTLESYTTCDWIDNAIVLPMEKAGDQIYGQLHFPCRVQVHGPRRNVERVGA